MSQSPIWDATVYSFQGLQAYNCAWLIRWWQIGLILSPFPPQTMNFYYKNTLELYYLCIWFTCSSPGSQSFTSEDSRWPPFSEHSFWSSPGPPPPPHLPDNTQSIFQKSAKLQCDWPPEWLKWKDKKYQVFARKQSNQNPHLRLLGV